MKKRPLFHLTIEDRILYPFVIISLLSMLAYLGLFLHSEYTSAANQAIAQGVELTGEKKGQLLLSCIEEQRYMILMGITALLIIVQTAVLIAYNISSPIRDLAEICTRISLQPASSGTEAVDEYAQRTDETGQLASAFHIMLLSIKEYMDQINWIRALNQGIVENLPLGVIVYDGTDNVVFRNPRAEMLEATTDETDDSGRPLSAIVDERLSRKDILPARVVLSGTDGKPRIYELAFWSLPAETPGSPPGTLCTIDDLSYQHYMEEKLSRDEKLAYTGQLAADVAHEVKNPLAGIRTGLQVLEKKLCSDRDIRLCREMIHEVDRVNLLITNFVNLARQRESEQVTLNLNELLGEMSLLYSKITENKGIRLRSEISGELWLLADEQQLRQILINLINNCIKAMPDGGEIVISAEKVSRQLESSGTAASDVLLTVADNGVGMSPEKVERVLRGETGGFGMTIVRRLVSQNNGAMEIESEEGQGTRIRLTFRGQEQR